MTTIKSYTDIEQSKKLAEILPLESADMYYHNRVDIPDNFPLPIEWKHNNPLLSQEIPCWSLSALLNVIPKEIVYKGNIVFLEFHVWENSFEYINGADYTLCVTESYDNPIDACYEMILKLHELNLL